MLTQAIPQLQRTAPGALPLNAIAAIAQSLGNCAQPMQHRGPVMLEQPFSTRNNGQLPTGTWDPGRFGYDVGQRGFIEAPRIYLGRIGDTSNYYGGNEFNFNTNNQFATIFNQGGPTFNVGGNSYFSNQYTNNLYSQNHYTTYINGGYGPSSPGLAGPSGAAGLPGAAGREGVTGAVGPRGSDGLPGLSGLPGPSGAPGSPGRSGSPGSSGEAGAAGENGIDGRDGASGAAGEAGPAGGDGQDGADGMDGPRGASGNDGRNGRSGRDGRAGKDGRDGRDGVSGLDGAHGVTTVVIFTVPGGGNNGPPNGFGRPAPIAGRDVTVLEDVKFNEETCKLELKKKTVRVLSVKQADAPKEVADV